MNVARICRATVTAVAATAGTRYLLGQRPPGGADKWTRTNHQGQPISLLEGPAAVAGLAAGVLCCGGSPYTDAAQRAAAALATLGAGTFGLVDDLSEDTSVRTKGIKGHFGALAQGRVTTGALKVLGIGTSAFVASAVRECSAPGGGKLRAGADIVTNTLLIAATANLLNLLDLRPGRALKSAAILAAIPAGGELAGPVLGAVNGVAAASWTRDLGSQDMLGDGGANALGALVGARLAFGLPVPAKLAALAGIVALNLASEKVSFSRVIEQTPWLRAIDQFGRG